MALSCEGNPRQNIYEEELFYNGLEVSHEFFLDPQKLLEMHF